MRRQDPQEIRDYIAGHRTAAVPFDLVMMGYTPADDPRKAQMITAPLCGGWPHLVAGESVSAAGLAGGAVGPHSQ